ncbi:threonine/serine exporter family protein [Parendozoicomonas haliclonae]|uniref:Threonine/Serine exporter ThrE domain-containing protein n=1 Tax=Parendozoicomonas haliclonae TaxID=1960125 RepID=A0A1X7ANW3_9GAMM|nr:threonine/serine exporter family protein [Parendozoicomonas haliclonae]SMA48767.1 hypothetical protein EHSB41UT_02879 [Parendozoicomonas haliclonae]
MITDATYMLELFEPVVMAGIVSAGFGILFSLPMRTLLATVLLGAVGVFVRISLINLGWSIIGGSFMAACTIGLLSMFLSWRFHAPCVVFSMPAVIPLVPGVFAYRTMLGILAFTEKGALDMQLMTSISSNGLNTAFMFLCLAVGVSLPNLLLRGSSIRSVLGLYRLRSDQNNNQN